MSLFFPRGQLYPPPGIAQGTLQIPLTLPMPGQPSQQLDRLTPQPLPLHPRPLFKGRAVRHREPFQEGAAVQGYGLCPPLGAFPRRQRLEPGYVELVIPTRVEADRLPGDPQGWGLRCPVANGRPQVGQGVAQVVTRRALRPIGPQQPGQRLAAVGVLPLHGQVGQQGAHLVGGKAADRLPVEGDLQGSQESNR